MLAGAAACAALAVSPALAGDGYPYDEPAASAPSDSWLRADKAPAFPGGKVRPVWGFEGGTRLWFSSGKYSYGINNPYGSNQISQLDFSGLTAQTAEIFGRFDVGNGFFFKGYAGGGSVSGGKLNDQDFPPYSVPTSNTSSDIKHGDLRYLTVDAGYDFWSGAPGRIGAFVGYGLWNERLNAFGCNQVAAGSACTGAGIGGQVDGLDADTYWNIFRVGAAGRWAFLPGFALDVDAAYARGYFDGTDYHNLRPDVSPSSLTGSGNGFMIDAILSWQATEALSFGAGGRWWHIDSTGERHYDQTLAGIATHSPPEALKVEQDRYGLLLQADYKFGAGSAGAGGAAPVSVWSGPYVGLNAGYGFGTHATTLAPATAAAAASSDSTLVGVPSSVDSRRGGLEAGVTVGWGWQVGRMVYGVEADAGYAKIGGSAATTERTLQIVDPATGLGLLTSNVTTTVESDISWLATIRGRLGYALTQDVLTFLSGGAAFGGVSAKADVTDTLHSGPCAVLAVCSSGSTSKTAVGWAVGGGVEYAINGWASVKTEYLHVDLGRVGVSTSDVSGNGFGYDASAKVTTDVVRSGLAVHF